MSSTSASLAQSHKRQHQVVGIQVGFTALSGLALVLRIWSRAILQSMPLGADDWTIVAAWILSLGFAVNVCVQTRYGLGAHVYDLAPGTNTPLQLKLYYIAEPIYYFVVALTKVSILFLYLKLLPSPSFRIAVWAVMTFVMLNAIAISIAGVFQCTPISKTWNVNELGTCFTRIDMFITHAVVDIVQDIIVYFMPVRLLWRLNLPQKQRIALVFVFAMGGFVIVTGIIRVPSLVTLGTSNDPTWDDFGGALWSSIEMNVGIVCASLIHYKAIIARFAPRLLGLSRRSKYDNGADGPTGPSIRLPDYRNGDGSNPSDGDVKPNQFSHPSKKVIGILTELSIETSTQQGNRDEDHNSYYPR